MENKLKKFTIAASSVAISASTAMVTVPQLSYPGYVQYDTKTQELEYVESNPVKAFGMSLVTDKIIEKNVVYKIPKPIKNVEALAKKEEYPVTVKFLAEIIKLLGSAMSCIQQPKDPVPPPVPPAPPSPEPVPGTDEEIADWGVLKIKALEAALKVDASNVGVCIIDTGIDLNHPDLRSRIVGSASFVPGENAQDYFGHGTHVAGVIGAAKDNKIGIKGVSNAKLYSAKVLSKEGYGDIPWIVNGIKWCRNQPGVKVISGSLGSDEYSSILHTVVRETAAMGIYQTYAAGNESQPTLGYPARHAADVTGVVAVTATRTDDMRATFSNYEVSITTIGAPGTNIYSTVPMGGCVLCEDGSGYMKMNGTSMATPHVAGVLAMMIAAGYNTLVGDTVKDATIGVRVNALKTVSQ